MKKGKTFISVALLASLVLFLTLSLPSCSNNQRQAAQRQQAAQTPITFKGTVEAVVENEAGTVTSVRIVGESENWKVAMNPKAKELIKLVGKTVEVNGIVTVKPNGSRLIIVKNYRVL